MAQQPCADSGELDEIERRVLELEMVIGAPQADGGSVAEAAARIDAQVDAATTPEIRELFRLCAHPSLTATAPRRPA